MGESFFGSDLFRFGSPILGILISALAIIRSLPERTPAKIVEVMTMVTFGIGGFGSLVNFVMHFFFADMVAGYIGWPPGSPFQKEVAGANLAVGLLGFMGFWRRDFWLPYVIAKSAFLWVAGITHVEELVHTGNFAAGNAGLTLYSDFLWPLVYVLLLWLGRRLGNNPPKGMTPTAPLL